MTKLIKVRLVAKINSLVMLNAAAQLGKFGHFCLTVHSL